jgi:cellulose synthase/poly-beta-1,6-N-acetylglucosamine synthase-like glycosyltransferase
MATTPYFLLSPNTVLSTIGLIRGPDKTVPTPTEDWKQAKVDVVIPALNEASNIPLCIESLSHQTFKPSRVILIDDGSTDQTLEYAQDIAKTCA